MAFVRARVYGGVTYYHVISAGGVERSAGRDRALARRWANKTTQMEWQLRAGEPLEGSSESDWTVQDLRDRDLEDARARGAASIASRERRWRVWLKEFDPTLPIDSVTADRIEEITVRRLRVVSANTIKRDRSVLSSALAFARRMRHVSGYVGDPFRRVAVLKGAPMRKPQAIPEAKVRKLFAAADALALRAPSHLRQEWKDNATMIRLAYLTGSRISQILGLRREWIAGGLLRFPPHKGGRERVWIVEGELRKALARIPPRAGVWAFPSATGTGHRDNFRRFLRTALKDAGLEHLTPHDLRHSHVTNELYAGKSQPIVAAQVGHKDTTMVARVYGHIFPERLHPPRAPRRKPRAGRASRAP